MLPYFMHLFCPEHIVLESSAAIVIGPQWDEEEGDNTDIMLLDWEFVLFWIILHEHLSNSDHVCSLE